MKNIMTKSLFAVLLMGSMGTLLADQGRGGQNERPRRGPPPEAISACSAKVEGDTCNFTGRFNETVVGTCRKGPQGMGELACRPKPPTEAFNACSGKNEGEACSFTGRRNNTVHGSCHKGPEGAEMVCIPKQQMLPPPEETQPEEAPTFD